MSAKNSKHILSRNLKRDIAKDINAVNGKIIHPSDIIENREEEIIITDSSILSEKSAFYRKAVEPSYRFGLLIKYRHSDILIISEFDISDKISAPLKKIYKILDDFIKKNPVFLKSLLPVKPDISYPEEINEMCRLTGKYNVGPMAAVAGTVNDYIANHLLPSAENLFIENGGDLFIKSKTDTVVNLFTQNPHFANKINIIIKSEDTPCGICSSSGTFGHSFSMGRCDLATVIADTSSAADAAATAVANSVQKHTDIQASLDYFSSFDNISGILIVKDKKLGAWGKIQLV